MVVHRAFPKYFWGAPHAFGPEIPGWTAQVWSLRTHARRSCSGVPRRCPRTCGPSPVLLSGLLRGTVFQLTAEEWVDLMGGRSELGGRGGGKNIPDAGSSVCEGPETGEVGKETGRGGEDASRVGRDCLTQGVVGHVWKSNVS